MKLSEAIRLGSMLHPQGRKAFFAPSGATCALGAALSAIGHSASVVTDSQMYDDLRERWPVLNVRVNQPHNTKADSFPLMYVIEDLNDVSDWTREQIADFVEAVEVREAKRHESTPSVAAVVPGSEVSSDLPARALSSSFSF